MSKELDYINKRIKDLEFKIEHPREYQISPLEKVIINDGAVYKEELEILKNIKHSLEAIDNAKPSEALECLDEIINEFNEPHYELGGGYSYKNELLESCENEVNSIRQALLKAQEQEEVLKILKEKEVNIAVLNQCEDTEEYNKVYGKQEERQLTQEEFDLLKRYFK